MANGKVVRNKMSQAFENALSRANEASINPGKIGAQILRNRYSGVGVVWRERLTLKKQKENNHTAVSADEGRMAA